MKFTTHIQHTKVHIEDERASQLFRSITKLADEKHGGYIKITVSTPARPRTTGDQSQNHHLNGHIQQICEDTGNDFADVKKYIKQQAISMGYPMKYLDDKLVLDMWGEPIGISEADSSVEECTILIEATHKLAAELGIILQEDWYNY